MEIKEIDEINNLMGLSELNKDNILEEDNSIEIIDIQGKKNLKNKIRYLELLNYISERDDKKYHNKNEFLCNILLIPSEIDISQKISTLSLLSYCYQENNKKEQIYKIGRKFQENVNFLNEVNPILFVRVFFRTAYFLKKKQNYIYSLKYLNKANNIIKTYIKSEEDKKVIDLVDKNNKEIFFQVENYLKNLKNKFALDDNYFSFNIRKKMKLIIDKVLQNNEKENENGDYLFAISKIWLIKLNNFLKDYNISKETNISDVFLDKAFDLVYFLECYYRKNNITEMELNGKNKSISFSSFPGPINNFDITDFKDNWNDNINIDENFYIKDDMKLNVDYCLINQNDWNFLNSYFGSTNEILRRKNNLELIKFKFILFDKRINNRNNNIDLLKFKYIQINKNLTIRQLKEKIINIMNFNLEKKIFNDNNELSKEVINNKNLVFYTLEKNKKEILIEICFGYIININKYESIYIDKLDLEDNITIKDFFTKYNKNYKILLIEVVENNKNNFLEDLKIKFEGEYKCTICNKTIKDINKKYNCNFCYLSIFCSKDCAKKSIDHLKLDQKLEQIFEPKFNLSNLLSIKLETLLGETAVKGRICLKNTGNYCFLNSCLQCLSNTEDLTKYFLNGDFIQEINNNNSSTNKGEISRAYNKLINKMWKENNNIIRPNKFLEVFFSKEKSFINNDHPDPYEFLLSLLKNVHNELNRVKDKQNIVFEEKKEDETNEKASLRYLKYLKKKEDSIINDLFQGLFKCVTKCAVCENKTITFEEFINLSLSLPNKKIENQIKLFLSNGIFIDLKIRIDKFTEIKDVIEKAIFYLDNTKYLEILTGCGNVINNHIINYNNTKTPKAILYNNIIVTEFTHDLKIVNIYKTSYNSVPKLIENKNGDLKNYMNVGSKNNILIINNKIIEFTNDNNKILNIYENRNNEIVLFERDINCITNNNIIDIFVYPIKEVKSTENNTNEIFKLSYPILISMKKDDSLKDLKLLIFSKFSKIFKGKFNKNRYISICFPHLFESWQNFKCPNKICPLCKEIFKKNNKYCLLFKNKKDDTKISEIIELLGNFDPLILYGKSQAYDLNSELYKNMKLFRENNFEFNKKIITIYDCLELFKEKEILIDGKKFFCKKCNKYQKVIKTEQIYKTPLYLIIHLDRFKGKEVLIKSLFGSKNETYIEYNTNLNLNNFVIGPDKDKSKYSLYGVVVHKRIINDFYSLSFCKNQGQWILYDNDKLECDKNPINKDAYILFFKKMYY